MRIVLNAFNSDGSFVGKINLGEYCKTESPEVIIYEIKSGIRRAYSLRKWRDRPFKYVVKLYNKHTRKRTILGYAYKNEHFYCMDFDIFRENIKERFTGDNNG